ncbi:restriction endonuclease [Candidatus Woesebacteria bacterium RIFOXYA1_FULL_40_18]|uniref:Dam-replacing family protein n=4 Tax=Candidatus Woeseibacteriota TaxID=1752722 RepID=A0A0G0SL81_9BACT|nr:MAG: Dam-replacing family protein [Candidatus Woesebacteria bacterium GW2011_GWB1_40_101]KKR63106.1 MAG: Dam-replacing family protein [Candidatus Woesebacteria bacterium GW2011_GWA1_40_45]OGM76551.1 MAG: restriction endonuclease [Candidatus Woesebacteria bacterium RIFOXYA1_FULL_40_18]OGM86930.1 MAG: restriction endonuclease [Candidatus Woesebacteria bacterium RIFOXYD1_FULL_40_21]
MNLTFDAALADGYKNQSQRIRILTEAWVNNQIYCPNCGRLNIEKYPNNQTVADFYCSSCLEDYELKSKQGNIGAKIVNGAYRTMVQRLQSNKNPNLFLLTYDFNSLKVSNFFAVPKYFFIPEMIEKRKPLAPTARRAGWIGCNIVLENLPSAGKVFFIKNGTIEPKENVFSRWQKTLFLREEKEIAARGWILEVMNCVEKLKKQTFSLNEMYAFEQELSEKHPHNYYIKEKIRQQLQVLRDKNYLEFTSRGSYRVT